MNANPSSQSGAGVAIQNGGTVGLSQPGHCYFIQSGRFEIYAMVGGRRIYLAEVSAGQSLLCAPCNQGQIIAVAPEGGIVIPQAANAMSVPVLAAMSDAWVLSLSEAVSRNGQARPIVQAMDSGMAQAAPQGKIIHAARGVLWVISQGLDLHFMGSTEPSQMVPISPALWANVGANGALDVVATELLSLIHI